MVLILHCAKQFRHFNSVITTTLWDSAITSPFNRYRDWDIEIHWLALDPTASTSWSYDLWPGILAPESELLATVIHDAILTYQWGNRSTEKNNLPKATRAVNNGAYETTKLTPYTILLISALITQSWSHTLLLPQISLWHLRKGNDKRRKGKS